jgi:hypothetical protein
LVGRDDGEIFECERMFRIGNGANQVFDNQKKEVM